MVSFRRRGDSSEESRRVTFMDLQLVFAHQLLPDDVIIRIGDTITLEGIVDSVGWEYESVLETTFKGKPARKPDTEKVFFVSYRYSIFTWTPRYWVVQPSDRFAVLRFVDYEYE